MTKKTKKVFVAKVKAAFPFFLAFLIGFGAGVASDKWCPAFHSKCDDGKVCRSCDFEPKPVEKKCCEGEACKCCPGCCSEAKCDCDGCKCCEKCKPAPAPKKCGCKCKCGCCKGGKCKCAPCYCDCGCVYGIKCDCCKKK